MITISDSIYASVPLPLDNKLCNLVPTGPNVWVESISEYLTRVPLLSRYLGMIVSIIYPSGTYENTAFRQMVEAQEITVTLYAFIAGIQDEDFLPWCPTCNPPIEQTRWVTDGDTICTKDIENLNTGQATTPEREEKRIDDGPWIPTGQTRIRTEFNPIFCPLPVTTTRYVETRRECVKDPTENNGYLIIYKNKEEQVNGGDWIVVEIDVPFQEYNAAECPVPANPIAYRDVETSRACIKVGGFNNATLRIQYKEQKSVSGGDWVDTGVTSFDDIYDSTTCPLPQYRFIYGSWSCNPDGIYNSGYKTRTVVREISLDAGATWAFESNYPNETTYDATLCPITPFGVWVSIDTELDGPYNSSIEIPYTYSPGSETMIQNPVTPADDYHYLFLSFPTGKGFELYEGGGNKITVVSVGTDNRGGYRGNTLYKYEECFTTDSAVQFKLKML